MKTTFKEFLLLESTKQLRKLVSKWYDESEIDLSYDFDTLVEKLDELYSDDNNAFMIAAKYYIEKGKLPNDKEVKRAVKIMKKKKHSYSQINSIGLDEYLNNFNDVIKEDYISPNEYPNILSLYKNIEEYGLTIYNIDESDKTETLNTLRRILTNHRGKNANPWCLLQGDELGYIRDDAFGYWDSYDEYEKMVAFKNGKMYAFYASSDVPIWWDLQDKARIGIVVDDNKEVIPGYETFSEENYNYSDSIDLLEDYGGYKVEKKDGYSVLTHLPYNTYEVIYNPVKYDKNLYFTKRGEDEYVFDNRGEDTYSIFSREIIPERLDDIINFVDKDNDIKDFLKEKNINIKKLIIMKDESHNRNERLSVPSYRLDGYLFKNLETLELDNITEDDIIIDLRDSNIKNLILNSVHGLRGIIFKDGLNIQIKDEHKNLHIGHTYIEYLDFNNITKEYFKKYLEIFMNNKDIRIIDKVYIKEESWVDELDDDELVNTLYDKVDKIRYADR